MEGASPAWGSGALQGTHFQPLTQRCPPSRCPSRQGWVGGICIPVGMPPPLPPTSSTPGTVQAPGFRAPIYIFEKTEDYDNYNNNKDIGRDLFLCFSLLFLI